MKFIKAVRILILFTVILFGISSVSTELFAAKWGMRIHSDFFTGNKSQDGFDEALSKTDNLGNLTKTITDADGNTVSESLQGRVVARQLFRKFYGAEIFFLASINKIHYFGPSIGYQKYSDCNISFQIVDSKNIEQRIDSLNMTLKSIPIFLNYYYQIPLKKIALNFGGGLGVYGMQYQSSFTNGKDTYSLSLKEGGAPALRIESGIIFNLSRYFSLSFKLGNVITGNLDPFVLEGKKNSSSFNGSWKKKSDGSVYITTSTSNPVHLQLSSFYIKFGFSYNPF